MFHVDNNSAVPVMPAVKPVVSAVTSFFTEGGNGVPPTYPGPDWFNIIQSELLAVLAAAGITPDKANNVQLLAAMRALFLDTSQNGADIQDKALFLQNLGIDRIDQDSTETRIWSPDGKNYIFVQNGVWGAYSINSPAGALSLGLGFGGTGATDAAGARTNLGLGDSSTRDVGTVSGTVAAGDDSRITGAMQQNQNGNDIPDKAEFRSNIGLGSAATRAVGNGANQIPDMSFFSAALAINGWAKLPNGLIIQQGTSTAATPSSPDVLVNFPIPFPTGVLHISEHDSNGGLSMTLWQLNNITRTAFYAGALGGVTRGNTTIQVLSTSAACNWFAIGY
ncbi:hypothetical protein JYQ93_06325 [Citrobacter freundii]|uniref:gp53-like domain-containing protein n=1 Tax=Citrobacter freundii TaxID=546 RepID=UPI0019571151|nr:hypothetical protein [Citrobacter freundii]MBM7308831.1 hypothetical protein [Citrobacter freundii]MBN4035528.1 hypothetical protein [Citrobacter freundii]